MRMDIRQLKNIARDGESQHVEFKKKVNFPDKIIKEVVAFANTDGGWLLLGVDDNGYFSGLKFPEEEKDILSQAIYENCRPQVKFKTHTIPLNQKKAIVAYEIPSSRKKPHRVRAEGRSFCYVRIKDRSVKASREMQEIIRRQRHPKDMNVQYGEKEQILMEYLYEHENITLAQYQRIASLSKKQASKTLVHLVLANILDIIPEEKGDLYFLHSTF